MLTVLSDLQALRILGEYVTGWDTCGLDNVAIACGPAAIQPETET